MALTPAGQPRSASMQLDAAPGPAEGADAPPFAALASTPAAASRYVCLCEPIRTGASAPSGASDCRAGSQAWALRQRNLCSASRAPSAVGPPPYDGMPLSPSC
eukprot:2980114-Prymnesium_polylepis.1